MCLSNKEIEIKHICLKDLMTNKNIIVNLLEENFIINFPNMTKLSEYALRGYDDMVRFKNDNSAILIGAFNGDNIVGFLWAYKITVLGENRIHLSHIIVNSDLRANGIGSRLLNALEDLSKEEGRKVIELMTSLENESTIKFYKAKGFSAVRVKLEKKLGK